MPESDFRASAVAGSGHPTSSLSAADIIAVLLDGYLTVDFQRPDDPRNDHLIFSKGHASLHYAMLKAAGSITDDEFFTYRNFGSRLEIIPPPASRRPTWPPARWGRDCPSEWVCP